jgi:UDP-glucose 4-epimerase
MFPKLKNQKIVVTGANGLIGSSICRYFELQGFNFLAVSRSKNKFNFKNFISIDLKIPKILDDFLDNETIVFHCASNTDVALSVSDPYADMQSNFLLFFEVIESVRRSNASLFFMSTGSVYDHKFILPKNEESYLNPVSPYSAGKLSAEHYCKAYAEIYGLDIKIARIFSIYGLGINRFVIHDLICRLSLKPAQIKIKGTGEEIRDFIHISDLVEAICFIAEFGVSGEVYNVASGKSISVIDLVILIRDLMNYEELEIITDSKSFTGDNKAMIADIQKLEMLGFKHKKSFISGLTELIEYKNND